MNINKLFYIGTDSNFIQENIRTSKEEQYQEGFLNDLFATIFGYVKNPNASFNLTTELKNIKNAKKTDGALLHRTNDFALIDLNQILSKLSLKKDKIIFEEYKKEVLILHNQIQTTDNEIDDLVFELYGLSKEEIEIVKKS